MAFDFVRLSPGDVDSAAVSFPAGDAGSEVLVRVGDSFVILFAKFIFIGVRVRIALTPKFLDKPLSLVVGLQFLGRSSLVVCNDVSDVLFQPVLVGPFYFRLDVSGLFGWFLVGI